MKTKNIAILATLAASGLGMAQTAFTTPVGYNTVTCLSNSDTVVAVPLTPSITFAGTTGVPTDNLDGTTSLVLSGNPNLNLAVGVTYYVKFDGGTHDGEFYQISDKTLGTTIKVFDMDVNLTNVAAASKVEIAPFWTLQTLFPDGNTTIVGSASNSGSTAVRKTTVLIPTTVSGASNVAPQATFFINLSTLPNPDWKSTTSGFPNADNTILWPDTYFIIRHDSTSGPTSFVNSGTVDEESFTQVLTTSATANTDNFVALSRPVNIRLDALGLGNASGPSAAFVPSTGNSGSSAVRGDTLLVFNNAAAIRNKAPSATYFFVSTTTPTVVNEWRSTASGFPVANDFNLNSAQGFIIRKKAAPGGASVFWKNSKNW